MKLTDEQIANIKDNYNNWEDGLYIEGDWIDGYKSGIYDTLIDLGYKRDEIKPIFE